MCTVLAALAPCSYSRAHILHVSRTALDILVCQRFETLGSKCCTAWAIAQGKQAQQELQSWVHAAGYATHMWLNSSHQCCKDAGTLCAKGKANKHSKAAAPKLGACCKCTTHTWLNSSRQCCKDAGMLCAEGHRNGTKVAVLKCGALYASARNQYQCGACCRCTRQAWMNGSSYASSLSHWCVSTARMLRHPCRGLRQARAIRLQRNRKQPSQQRSQRLLLRAFGESGLEIVPKEGRQVSLGMQQEATSTH